MDSEELIQKEDIRKFQILPAAEDHSLELRAKLEQAVRLGNGTKSKSVITFQTSKGPKKVETTVWALTEKYLQLKNEVMIPLNSIIDIRF